MLGFSKLSLNKVSIFKLRYIKILETELKLRIAEQKPNKTSRTNAKNISTNLTNRSSDHSLNSRNSIQKHDFFDYKENLKYTVKKLDAHFYEEDEIQSLEDHNYEDLLKTYQANLIRYQIIFKLNTELIYARCILDRAMRTQEDLIRARERVEWLENEIERILLSNKNVGEI